VNAIAEGRTAEVFERGPGVVLKLFRAGYARERAEDEARRTRLASCAGVPVPRVGPIVEVDGRYGIEFERVAGPLLVEQACSDPERIPNLAVGMARCHQAIHAARADDSLPDLRVRLRERIRTAGSLSTASRARVIERLGAMPWDHRLCHGDFHAGNLIVTAHGLVVIDWADAAAGPPEADVARSVLIMSLARGEGSAGLKSSHNCIERFCQAYLAAYCGQTGRARSLVETWMPVIAAARLCERVRGEKLALLQIIDDGLPG
jgi:aminoglycoside phosphotransferase (APT) family kinase protein